LNELYGVFLLKKEKSDFFLNLYVEKSIFSRILCKIFIIYPKNQEFSW